MVWGFNSPLEHRHKAYTTNVLKISAVVVYQSSSLLVIQNSGLRAEVLARLFSKSVCLPPISVATALRLRPVCLTQFPCLMRASFADSPSLVTHIPS